MTSWLTARKNSRRAMAAVSASPPIGATAAAFVAGREAGLSIKPLIARNGQRYGANGDRDRRVFDERWRVRPISNFLVFWAGCRGLLATARSLRKVLRRYLIFGANPFMRAI